MRVPTNTTLGDVYAAVKGLAGEQIILPDDTIEKAKKCIDVMLELG